MRIRSYGKFLAIVGGGLQITLQSMDVHKGWTIAIAMINILGAALPVLAEPYESPKTIDTKSDQSEPNQTP